MFKHHKNIILLGLFLLTSLSSYSFRLDNILFNQRIDTVDGGYRESYIINNSLNKERYKITVLKGDKRDGSKYVQVYPKIITVDPKSKGIVKIFVKAPSNLQKGEYDFKLQFKPISIPTLAKAKDGRITGTSNVPIAPVVGMKGYVGEVDFKEALQLENIKIIENKSGKGITLEGKLSNNSFAGIDFGAEAYGSNNFLYGSAYVADLGANVKNKNIKLEFPQIKNPRDLKKIIFYRTPSDRREVIKEIKIND